MQSASSKFVQNVFALAVRQSQLEFHTSTYILKGGPRATKKSFKGKGAPRLARSPARKRLAPNLRPPGRTGIYEVAARERSKSRDETHRRGRELVSGRDDGVQMSRGPPRESRGDPNSFRRDRVFGQGDATRRVPPTSGVSKRRFIPPHEEYRPHRKNTHGRSGAGPQEYRRSSPVSSRERKQSGLNDRGTGPPLEDYHSKRKFGDQNSGRHASRGRGDDVYQPRSDRPQQPKAPPSPLPEEFETPASEPLKTLPSRFTSPPLLDGLFESVIDVLGADAKPSPIQSLSLKHLFTPPSHITSMTEDGESDVSPLPPSWSQYLLASETGSGKSMAYLLPMIQYLKLTEHHPAPLLHSAPLAPQRSLPLNPRGLILAPTHELTRQLSTFAKALLHHVRLKVLCTSRANNASSSRGKSSTASQLKRELDDTGFGMTGSAQLGAKGFRPVDVLVGTPMKILEMSRGWGWDKEGKIEEQWDDARKERAKRWIPGPPEAGLANIEWVVVDEADVLFDPDFQESTRMLLADISRARGYMHPSFSSLDIAPSTPTPPVPDSNLAYPFHLLLTSATIPSSLATYLSANHPNLIRLASPNLHRLPTTLKTEYHSWASGNKNADIEKRVRRVWADDMSTRSKAKSKVLIFCNKSSKVDDLGLYLTEKGIPNVALTSTGQARHRGSNRHLAGFLKTVEDASSPAPTLASDPYVMITTSLLSRGLDFSPQIKHVFIVDEPRNMIDFLHRAGRSGRAGHEGKVVVFGKTKGRGAGSAREVKRKVGALA